MNTAWDFENSKEAQYWTQSCMTKPILCNSQTAAYLYNVYSWGAALLYCIICFILQQEKAVAPVQAKKPNAKKTTADNAGKLGKNLKKKQNKEDAMVGKSYNSQTISDYYADCK
jgi:ribosome-binding protein aMBF1 (putative translation factor)